MKLKECYKFVAPHSIKWEPWTSVPCPIYCEVISDDIETALKEAEKLTGLSVKKGQMNIQLGYANWYIQPYPKQPKWLWDSNHKLWCWYQLVYKVYLTVSSPVAKAS
jgi:hypothetical protein